ALLSLAAPSAGAPRVALRAGPPSQPPGPALHPAPVLHPRAAAAGVAVATDMQGSDAAPEGSFAGGGDEALRVVPVADDGDAVLEAGAVAYHHPGVAAGVPD